MKLFFLCMLCIGLLGVTGFTQHEAKDITVPATVKTAFEKAFPASSKVKWEKEAANYEVNFLQQDKKMSAVYDSQGDLQETELTIKVTELPATVTAYIDQHHKGAKIKEAAKITKANGELNYEAEVNKTDLLFDADGKFIKEAKD